MKTKLLFSICSAVAVGGGSTYLYYTNKPKQENPVLNTAEETKTDKEEEKEEEEDGEDEEESEGDEEDSAAENAIEPEGEGTIKTEQQTSPQ